MNFENIKLYGLGGVSSNYIIIPNFHALSKNAESIAYFRTSCVESLLRLNLNLITPLYNVVKIF